MRIGLVGTGPWAGLAHGPGLRATEGIDLVGVWGRDPAKASALAGRLDTTAYDDYPALLDAVEAVAFAVPPDVQATLAREAAAAGRHLLLDKPVSTTVADAQALSEAVAASGVASVVFFTDRFDPEIRAWLSHVRATPGWRGAWYRWFSALQEPGNPFGASPWRHERGALWDTGPHAVSMLMAALGPVRTLTATPGDADLVTLVLDHDSGATSTVTLTQFAPPSAICAEAVLWGESGFSTMPSRPGDVIPLLSIAARELAEAASTGRPHPVDVEFGVRVVEVLARAQAAIDAHRA